MRKFLTLVTVFMISAVSYGATTVAEKPKEHKLLIVGSDSAFMEVAKEIFKDSGFLVVSEKSEVKASRLEILQEAYIAELQEDPGKVFEPLIYDKTKTCYTIENDTRKLHARGKPIQGKHKHIRQARNAI